MTLQFSDQSKTCTHCHRDVMVNTGLENVGYHKVTVEAFKCPECEQINIIGDAELP